MPPTLAMPKRVAAAGAGAMGAVAAAATGAGGRAVSPRLHGPLRLSPFRGVNNSINNRHGSPTAAAAAAPSDSDASIVSGMCARVAVHYHRADGAADQFGLHVWEDVAGGGTEWDEPLTAVNSTASSGAPLGGGAWVTYDVALALGAQRLSFITHRGDEHDARVEGYDVTEAAAAAVAAAATSGDEIAASIALSLWVVQGSSQVYTEEPDLESGGVSKGDLSKARAIWVAADVVAVPLAPTAFDGTQRVFELVASNEGPGG